MCAHWKKERENQGWCEGEVREEIRRLKRDLV